jgi:hypothetical protein
MRNVHWLETPALVESVEARDRRDCVELYTRADGSNRDFAQWLLDHKSYPNTVVAEWNGCSENKIRKLRAWAKNGFKDSPYQADLDRESTRSSNQPLKTNDDFSDDDFEPGGEVVDGIGGVADPAHTLKNALDSISGAKAVAEAWRKILKATPFDSEAKAEICNAITLLIAKWRTVQTTLEKKGQGNGSQSKDN